MRRPHEQSGKLVRAAPADGDARTPVPVVAQYAARYDVDASIAAAATTRTRQPAARLW